MPTVLDTHAWIWCVTRDRRLSARARTAITKAAAGGSLHLSMFSIWEVAKKVEKGQLALDRPLDEWLDTALEVDGLQLVDLTRAIVVDSCQLPQPFQGDPADQMIVATTRALSATLITKDVRLRDYAHVRTMW
ncbi:MAG TPA: type II toxin-antitoxin system VapC family toxin [Vicinamibacterales bacterium]|nr:type II toxin-antitoxin system VapC family toxin [Vicinamibacterales bacterium]